MKPTENLQPVSKNGFSLFEIEYPENSGEYHIYDIGHNDEYVSVGSVANIGLLVDFYIEKDEDMTIDQHLEALYEIIYESLVNDEELKGLIEL